VDDLVAAVGVEAQDGRRIGRCARVGDADIAGSPLRRKRRRDRGGPRLLCRETRASR